MSRYTLVVNVDRCIGCHACEMACKVENDVALGSYWNRVLQVGPTGEYPSMHVYWLPVQCQQCEDAPCVHVCPAGASYRDSETGIVLVDKAKCIGCKYCMMACPYGVRSWNEEERVVEKCTLCSQRTAAGGLPKCVEDCCADARFFGDLDDPNSPASIAIKEAGPAAVHLMSDTGNRPTSRYILSSSIGEWVEVGKLRPVTPDWANSNWEEKQ